MTSRVEIHDDVFPHKLQREIDTYLKDVSYKEGWHTSSKVGKENTILHAEFGHGGRHNREDVKENINSADVLAAWDVIQTKVIREPRVLLRCYANQMNDEMEGYPHRDTTKENKDDLTCVCYFCGPGWKMEWGGETALVRADEIIKSVMPKENRVFLFPSHMVHIARSVTRLCERPRIVLVFKSSPA